MIASGFGLVGSVQHAEAQADTFAPALCFAIDESNDGELDNHLVAIAIAADGLFTPIDLGVINNGAGASTRNLESLAYRNGFEPHAIYSFDPDSNSLIRINTTNGADTIRVAVMGLGDIDGLTWRFDNDADPGNDELWGVVRRHGKPDQIVGIDPETGAVLAGPTDIATEGTGQEDVVDDLAWDWATGLFYAPVNGPSLINDLITIDTNGTVSVVGSTGVKDIEGLGFTEAGDLFGITGNAGPNANEFLSIDKSTGVATSLMAIDLFADYEGFDCASDEVLGETVTPVPTGDPTPDPPVSPVPTSDPTPTPDPTGDPTVVPTIEPTPDPVSPVPTPDPTPDPTGEPTPTPDPTGEPTMVPTTEPTPDPSPDPVVEPTPQPTGDPTPTPDPTGEPTPTPDPTGEPTMVPTIEPTPDPTPDPTPVPTIDLPPNPLPGPNPAPSSTPVRVPVPDEVFSTEETPRTTAPPLAVTGGYARVQTMMGLVLLGSGAFTAAGQRRRRSFDLL